MFLDKAARLEILRDPAYVQAMQQYGGMSPQVRAVLFSIVVKRQAVFQYLNSKKRCGHD